MAERCILFRGYRDLCLDMNVQRLMPNDSAEHLVKMLVEWIAVPHFETCMTTVGERVENPPQASHPMTRLPEDGEDFFYRLYQMVVRESNELYHRAIISRSIYITVFFQVLLDLWDDYLLNRHYPDGTVERTAETLFARTNKQHLWSLPSCYEILGFQEFYYFEGYYHIPTQANVYMGSCNVNFASVANMPIPDGSLEDCDPAILVKILKEANREKKRSTIVRTLVKKGCKMFIQKEDMYDDDMSTILEEDEEEEEEQQPQETSNMVPTPEVNGVVTESKKKKRKNKKKKKAKKVVEEGSKLDERPMEGVSEGTKVSPEKPMDAGDDRKKLQETKGSTHEHSS